MPAAPAPDFAKVNAIFETEVGQKHNFAALSQVYTSTARILPPGGQLITGLEHIQAFWQQAVDVLHVEGLKLNTVEINQIGDDTAIEIGRADLQITGDPAGTAVNYLVVWKRDADGSWKWDIDIWNQAAAS